MALFRDLRGILYIYIHKKKINFINKHKNMVNFYYFVIAVASAPCSRKRVCNCDYGTLYLHISDCF